MVVNSFMDSIHGGDIYTNGVFKGRKLLDFSSNINPLGIPNSFEKRLMEGLLCAQNYPDIEYREVRIEIIKYLKNYYKFFHVKSFKADFDADFRKSIDFDENNLVLGNGAAEIIDLVIACHKKILIVVPSFVEYEIDASRHGLFIEYFYLEGNMNINYEKLLKQVHNVDAVIIGNPNNPNGAVIDKNKFLSIIEYCEENNKTIIIDEAFIEFTNNYGCSFLEEATRYKCIFLIRALTKFYAMPGIRFGYGVSKNADILDKIRYLQNPWNINCFAELAVKTVLRDENYIASSLAWIKKEKLFMSHHLKTYTFIEKVYDTESNFILCKLNDINCNKVYEFCLENGLLIRRANNFRGLDENYMRLAIKDREKNIRALSIMKMFDDKMFL